MSWMKLLRAAALLLCCLTLCCACGKQAEASAAASSAGEISAASASASADAAAASAEEEQVSAYDDLDESLYPYYAQLDEDARTVFREVAAGIENGEEEITPSVRIDRDEMEHIATCLAYDMPQLFWYTGQLDYSYGSDSGEVTVVRPQYNLLANRLEVHREEFDTVMQELVAGAAGMDAVEAERYFHDELCRRVSYGHGDYDQTVYSALVRGETVCAGYTHTMQYLMTLCGFPCYFCPGDGYDSETGAWEGHSWNLVELDGSFYCLDVTWDDSCQEPGQELSAISYQYYNRTDADLADTHVRGEYGELLPQCAGTDCSFEALYGRTPAQQLAIDMGCSDGSTVDSLQDYYDLCRAAVLNHGTGGCTVTFVTADPSVAEAINNLTFDDECDSYLKSCASELGLNGWSYSRSLQRWELGTACIYYEVTINLSAL